MARPAAAGVARSVPIKTRFTPSEAAQLREQAAQRGGMDASAYIRYLVRQDSERLRRERGQ